MTISLAGCVLSGQPKTVATGPPPPQTVAPAPPPEPLSIPQTHVDLPPPQPVNPDAVPPPAQPVEPTPSAPAKPPVQTPHVPHSATPQPKPPDPQPATAEPDPPLRPQIHEDLPADAKTQLLESARKHRADTTALMAGARPHTANQKRTKEAIEQFLKQSTDAEAAGDVRLADQLAERAYVLAKDLQNGK